MVTKTRKTTENQIPEVLGQTLGDRLEKSLKYAGMTQQDMAEFLEVHRNTISGYTTGKTRMMPAIMRLWAVQVDLPLEWLRTGVWPEDPTQPAPAPVKKTPVKAPARAAVKAPTRAPNRVAKRTAKR